MVVLTIMGSKYWTGGKRKSNADSLPLRAILEWIWKAEKSRLHRLFARYWPRLGWGLEPWAILTTWRHENRTKWWADWGARRKKDYYSWIGYEVNCTIPCYARVWFILCMWLLVLLGGITVIKEYLLELFQDLLMKRVFLDWERLPLMGVCYFYSTSMRIRKLCGFVGGV